MRRARLGNAVRAANWWKKISNSAGTARTRARRISRRDSETVSVADVMKNHEITKVRKHESAFRGPHQKPGSKSSISSRVPGAKRSAALVQADFSSFALS
jgi:hypothetical protein